MKLESSHKPLDCEDLSALEQLVRAGVTRKDVGDVVVPELGYLFTLWNGKGNKDSISLNISCGVYQGEGSRVDLGNCVTIRFSESLSGEASLDVMHASLCAAAHAWQPRWAGIMSQENMHANGFDSGFPFVDWMVYIDREVGPVPAPSQVYSVGEGSLIVTTPKPPQLESEEDQRAIKAIQDLISGSQGGARTTSK